MPPNNASPSTPVPANGNSINGSAKTTGSQFKGFVTKNLRGFHRQKVCCVGWNFDGTRIATGGTDFVTRIRNPETNTRELELRGHTSSVEQLGWSPVDPNRLATVSLDKTVRLWDTRQTRPTHVVDNVGENINVTWSPDGQHIAVGNRSDVVTIIRSQDGKVQQIKPHEVEINELCWTKDGKYMLLTTGVGTIMVREWPGLELVYEMNAHTANAYCIECDPRGRYFATGGADAKVGLWDLVDFTCSKTLVSLEWPIRTIGFSFDGEFLATAGEDPFIEITDVESGQQAHRLQTGCALNSLAWHPSRYILAYAGDTREPFIEIFGSPKDIKK